MDQDCVAGGGEGEAAAKRPSASRVCWVKAAPEQQSKTSAVFALPEGEEAVSPSGFSSQRKLICVVSGLQAEVLLFLVFTWRFCLHRWNVQLAGAVFRVFL